MEKHKNLILQIWENPSLLEGWSDQFKAVFPYSGSELLRRTAKNSVLATEVVVKITNPDGVLLVDFACDFEHALHLKAQNVDGEIVNITVDE